MTIIKCSEQYIDQCVEVHLKSFKGFFLTLLGEKFLKLLYKSIIEDPTGIGYVFLTSNKVAGFVFGSSQPTGLYKRLIMKRFLKFCFTAFGTILKKPKIIFRLIKAFSLASQRNSQPGRGTLMSIAVDPDYQGKSIGKMLVLAFLNESRNMGCHSIDLTTDAVDNDPVNDFYKRMGFIIYRTFTTPEGREMNEFFINLE